MLIAYANTFIMMCWLLTGHFDVGRWQGRNTSLQACLLLGNFRSRRCPPKMPRAFLIKSKKERKKSEEGDEERRREQEQLPCLRGLSSFLILHKFSCELSKLSPPQLEVWSSVRISWLSHAERKVHSTCLTSEREIEGLEGMILDSFKAVW